MGYRGKPEFVDLPLPGDDCARLPIAPDDPDRGIIDLNQQLLLDGRMAKKAGGYWGPTQPMPSGAEHYEPLGTPERPETVRTVEGRRDVVFGFREKGMRVLWQYGGLEADGTPVPQTPVYATSVLLDTTPEQSDSYTRNWEVQVWAYEQERILPAGSPAVSAQPVALVPENLSSRLRVRIAWSGSSGGVVRDLDVAQGLRLAIRAPKVTVYMLCAQPALLQVQGEAQPQYNVGLGGGLVLDSEIGVSVQESDTIPGVQLGTLTDTIRVAAGVADVPVRIPPGARAVTVYQTSNGASGTLEWRSLRSNVIVGPSLGQIVLGPSRRSDRIDRIGGAGRITTGPADAVTRFFTFVWDIDV